MTRNEIAQYACRNTKFYHEKYRELLKDCAWEDLPIIQKHEVVHAGVSIISAEYFSMIGDSRMIRIYTSGSTGESMELFTTNAEQAKALLSLWLYRRKYYNINMDAMKWGLSHINARWDIYILWNIMHLSKLFRSRKKMSV